MTSRRTFLAGALSVLPASARRIVSQRMGIEIYSLRYKAEKDLPGTLGIIRKFGFEDMEVGNLYGRTAAEFRKLLDNNGLKASSMMAEHDRLANKIESVAEDAHTLGVQYVVCSTIPHHNKKLAVEEARAAADDLNRWGEHLAGSGLHCCYHTHGIEFEPGPDGTVFDTLAKRTDPKFANFEMDIFWIVYAYQDPGKLMHRYTGRFPLMHIKDIRKGTKLGGSPGDVREEESVPLGQGLVDFPPALSAARDTGVRHYYIEDEAVDAERQIPESLRYLETLHVKM
jgi:sugar phosphate isomerase/epimerase